MELCVRYFRRRFYVFRLPFVPCHALVVVVNDKRAAYMHTYPFVHMDHIEPNDVGGQTALFDTTQHICPDPVKNYPLRSGIKPILKHAIGSLRSQKKHFNNGSDLCLIIKSMSNCSAAQLQRYDIVYKPLQNRNGNFFDISN